MSYKSSKLSQKTHHFTSRILLPALLYSAACSFSANAESSGDNAEAEVSDPASFLEFSSELDGRCQILSSGGKLRLVKNNHPDKSIRYRFKRIFAGKPQAGLVIGTLDAGGKPVKLGCTEVDGREQNWEIKIAKFVD